MTAVQDVRDIKIEHFKNLVAVAFVDGYFDTTEQAFLSEKAVEYGLSKEEVEKIIADADRLIFKVPLNDYDKEEQLADVVYMAIIDGVVRQTEYDLCLSIAYKLGFDKEYVDDTIELTKKLWRAQ